MSKNMTIKEKLLQEFECAINAEFGSMADEEFENNVAAGDIDLVAHKVKFYMDLD